MTHTVHIVVPEKLCAKYARTGYSAKHKHIKDKNQLVCNGNTGHFYGAYPSDHYIIQKTHKICNGILDHNGNADCQHAPIKLAAPEQFVLHIFLPTDDVRHSPSYTY